MSSKVAHWGSSLSRIREPLALVVWIYAIIKVFVFDIDLYLIGRVAPDSMWLLNLRLLVIAGALALAWLLLGHRIFFIGVAYVVAYPLIVLFWKLPRLVWRQWAAMLILLPSFYSTLGSLRSTFVLYTAAAISTAIIVVSNSQYLLALAMLYLVFFLLVISYRAFKSAQSSSVFSRLAEILRKLHPKIISGEYDQVSPATPQTDTTQADKEANGAEIPQLSQLYMLHVAADFVASRVRDVSKDRQYNALLAASLLIVVGITVFIFALINWALFKIDPRAFDGVDANPLLHFIAYSIGRLATADLTSIQPISPLATFLAVGEVFFSLVILVIIGFSILTAARDAYREDFHEFESALHDTASVIEDRIGAKYQLTAVELEIRIADTSRDLVNVLRRMRGMPEIEGAEDEERELMDGESENPTSLAP